MRRILRLLGGWFAVSLPLGLFLGRFIAAGQQRRTVELQGKDSAAAELKLKATRST